LPVKRNSLSSTVCGDDDDNRFMKMFFCISDQTMSASKTANNVR